MRLMLSALAAAAFLAGCGGGGGGDATPVVETRSATGLWTGTTSTNRSVTGVVLADGTYYVLYSGVGAPLVIGGVVQGTGSVNGSTFSSSNGRDFNLEGAGVLPANVSATVNTKQSLNGAVGYSNGGSTSFTSTYDANFEQAPTLAAIAGTYSGNVAFSLGVDSATVTVSSAGAISGGSNGCAITGTVAPRADGNAYNMALTFGAAPCYFAGQTFNGIAYYNAGAKRLYAAAPNGARTDGVLFVGVKP